MSSRDYIKHVSTTSEPQTARLGDEWFDTVNNKLYKEVLVDGTTAASRQVIVADGAGKVSITSLEVSSGTASTPPIKLTAGTDLTTVQRGALEFDGNILEFTPNTDYGRSVIPLTVYTSGTGTSLTPTATGEATAQALFPSSSDTITLPIGTYYIMLAATITRGATSATSATARINLAGGGTAVGTFSGTAISSIINTGASSQFMFNNVALTVDNVVSAANTTAAGVYNIYLTGILRITTAGTFIPKYSLSVALTGATTATSPSALNYIMLQSLTSSGSAASTGGWA